MVVSLFCFCSSEQKAKDTNLTRYDYPDILDMSDKVHSPQQESLGSMSDMGTWHSFSLHKKDDKKNIGGFIGPYLMRQQKSFWLSPSIACLQIKDEYTGKAIDLSEAEHVENVFYPGMLQQTFVIDDLHIVLHLFNCNERTTLITAALENKGSCRNLQLGWKGEIFTNLDKVFKKEDKGISVNLNDEESAQVIFEDKSGSLNVSDSCYSYFSSPISLKSDAQTTTSIAFTYTFNKTEKLTYGNLALKAIKESTSLFADNEKRWNRYINELFKCDNKSLLDAKEYDLLAVKSLVTLINNWRSKAGQIFHQGIIPSYSANYFQGFWAWDSWKHAVAIAPFEGELAKDQIRAMYDYQDKEGMIVDCFFRDLSIEGINRRNTKAPLSGWSIYKVYEITKDIDFLKEMYPKLVKYHEWWYKNRDNDNNGICEYGSTDGTRIAAAWESGMDNAVRFDNAVIIKNHDGAYSLNQESVDLNSYLYQEKIYLEKIANELGYTDDAKKYEQQAKMLKEKVCSLMYCPDDGFFYDIELKTHRKIRIQGAEGWAPLYNHLATNEQASKVVESIMDTAKFNTPLPFPTLSAARKEFNPQKGYWRGPVWLDQAYFAIVGMYNYGFREEAVQMAKKLIDNAEGLSNSQAPIRENYHPISKQGLNAYNFSWSAAHILMLFESN